MMAEALGRKLHMVRDVRRTFRQGLWAAVMIAVPSWMVLWHAEAILILFDQEPQLAADAQVFVHALQWGLLPTLGFIALRSFVAALERPLWALMVTGGRDPVQHRRELGAGVRSSWFPGTRPARLRHRDDVVEHLSVRRAGAGGELWPQVPSLSSVRQLVARRLAAARHAVAARSADRRGAGFEITVFNAAVFLMGSSARPRSPLMPLRFRSPRSRSWCRWDWRRRRRCASVAPTARATSTGLPARDGRRLPWRLLSWSSTSV